jgi:hypothetical protein
MTILLHKQFKKDFKTLAKKYPSLERDLDTLIDSLRNTPLQGTSLGNNRYKIRLKISSKATSKSGGARVITYAKIVDDELWLLTIYDKSDIENVSDAFLDDLLKTI